MLRTIVLTLLLMCMSLAAWAQPGITWPDQPGSEQGQAASLWYSLDIGASQGGSVTPNGLVRVKAGDTVVVAVRPDRGYTIYKVIIDGRRVNVEAVYKFTDIQRNHTMFVEFAPAVQH